MNLPTFTLFLDPVHPPEFTLPEFRASLARDLAEHPASAPGAAHDGQILYRYPAILCKQLKNNLAVIGICQGARFLRQLADNNAEILSENNSCRIVSRDPEIHNEEFGITGRMYAYEILIPYLALNQQNAKKFYGLKGKPARDAFMQKILTGHLNTLAKSLDYSLSEPITCTARVRFIQERIDRENRIVFLGKFTTNLCIPDYLGIGQSVSSGYGTIRKICAMEEPHQDPATIP
ncbi:CRISPR-associated endonuclease Cas6 [Methanoregula formicica]|uniref:Uncharacterized protein n=1 Tax=Methanoregula formicica (strain DSM 22288 / NBRC 105244 / SMSP) TaxID=593750 RepID=L0HFX7_METFS|nr:CRISPR-associated endonuclease Cas6 [Methanoregula formicica]AGB02671.1 hypothetical protein Metfor_1641 [Methanoregula formicica SMSP]